MKHEPVLVSVVGVDLAAEPVRTAVAVLGWDHARAVVEDLRIGADDEAVLAALAARELNSLFGTPPRPGRSSGKSPGGCLDERLDGRLELTLGRARLLKARGLVSAVAASKAASARFTSLGPRRQAVRGTGRFPLRHSSDRIRCGPLGLPPRPGPVESGTDR